jgi:hypothetical protein
LLKRGRGGFYLHGSAVSAASAARLRAIISTLQPAVGGGTFEAGENGFFDRGNAYDTYLAASGYVPQHMLVNVESSLDFMKSPAPLARYLSWVDAVRVRFHGITVAPVLTPGGDDPHLNLPFATDPYWAPERKADYAGGAVMWDLPAQNLGIAAWTTFNESVIRWGKSQGLRTEIIISPGTSTTFMADVQAVLRRLIADNAVPAVIDVENYRPGTDFSNGANTIGPLETTPNSLTAVALWIAQNKPR